MDLLSFASHQLRRAADIVDEVEKLKKEMAAALGSSPGVTKPLKGKRRMSAAGRLAIAAGQKARWAKMKAKSVLKPAKGLAKRTMSAAAKAKIAAAAKARWAKAKAAGRKSL